MNSGQFAKGVPFQCPDINKQVHNYELKNILSHAGSVGDGVSLSRLKYLNK